MPHAKVNGVDIYYERHGDDGEPLVLVHGYTGDLTDWRHQVTEFAATHRLLIMDQRGHGRSEAPADRADYTIENMSHDIEALVALAGFERYHLLGHSMGGAVVQEIALRSPHRLLSLTLHDTSYEFGMRGDERMEAWRDMRFKLAETKGMRAVADLPPIVPPAPHMPVERQEETKERLANMSVHSFIGAWQGLVSWPGAKERLPSLAMPTLVIYGELDAPPLVRRSLRMGQLIPGVTLEAIPEAAHSPQWERPALFNAALRRFLERNGAGAAK